jgi:adenine-specific DNA-methyltransferase
VGGFSLNWDGKTVPKISNNFFFKTIETMGGGSNTLIQGLAVNVCDVLINQKEKFDLIYIDPPFGTGRNFKTKRIKKGYQDKSVEDLITELYPVLVKSHDLLTKAGSILLHLDYRSVWAAKLLLDEIYGLGNFQNQIIWNYRSGGRTKRRYARKHDVILWYSKNRSPTFNSDQASISKEKCPLCSNKIKGSHLKTVIDEDGNVKKVIKSNGKLYYYDPSSKRILSDVWLDISHLHQLDPERTGYPTQKPSSLMERIVSVHSPIGGRVLDLYAGSGTTLFAAETLGRKWVGSDIGDESINLIWKRVKTDKISAISSQLIET